jgi:Glucose / Sorbosone dehydrogenase
MYTLLLVILSHRTQTQNIVDGPPSDGTGGIIRITQDGRTVADNPLGSAYPQNLYYAYGIRNSFCMDFDYLTGKLWDTENGPNYGDEINLVEPGFNSGWAQVQGLWTPNGDIGDENAGQSIFIHLTWWTLEKKENTDHLNLHGIRWLLQLRSNSLIPIS